MPDDLRKDDVFIQDTRETFYIGSFGPLNPIDDDPEVPNLPVKDSLLLMKEEAKLIRASLNDFAPQNERLLSVVDVEIRGSSAELNQ